jgi:heptosyltransferase-2
VSSHIQNENKGDSITATIPVPAGNILVFSLPGIGDTLNTIPVLGVLRKTYTKAKITTVVMFKSSYDILENNPYVDELIYWPFVKKGAWESLKFMMSLRKRRFDIAIMSYPANRMEYNLLSLLSGARLRIAHRYNHRTWQSLFFINSRTIMEDDKLHNVEENIRLLSLLGINENSWDKPRIHLTEQDKSYAQSWISKRKLDNKGDLIAFHPGCATFKNHIKRRWALERYVKLGQRLVQEEGAHILVFGGTREDELKNKVAREIGEGAHAIYESTMTQAAALIARCRMMVSGDTGLMHIAGAIETPVVAIFGPTNINWVYPYRSIYKLVSKNLPCSPRFQVYNSNHRG